MYLSICTSKEFKDPLKGKCKIHLREGGMLLREHRSYEVAKIKTIKFVSSTVLLMHFIYVPLCFLNRSTSLEFPPRLSVALYGFTQSSERQNNFSGIESKSVIAARCWPFAASWLEAFGFPGWQTATFLRCRISQVEQALPQYLSRTTSFEVANLLPARYNEEGFGLQLTVRSR